MYFVSALLNPSTSILDDKEVQPKKEEQVTSSSIFQRQRVDMLLMELSKKFPVPQIPLPEQRLEETAANRSEANKPAETVNIKQEPVETNSSNSQTQNSSGPPEKKIKLNN